MVTSTFNLAFQHNMINSRSPFNSWRLQKWIVLGVFNYSWSLIELRFFVFVGSSGFPVSFHIWKFCQPSEGHITMSDCHSLFFFQCAENWLGPTKGPGRFPFHSDPLAPVSPAMFLETKTFIFLAYQINYRNYEDLLRFTLKNSSL